jgi:hypothetical protein
MSYGPSAKHGGDGTALASSNYLICGIGGLQDRRVNMEIFGNTGWGTCRRDQFAIGNDQLSGVPGVASKPVPGPGRD